jgi:lactoylglutathione lyase
VDLLVNIDVPDLAAGISFYVEAFGLSVSRRLGPGAAELTGWPATLYLLEQPAGSPGAGESLRRYDRHWTPVHLDIVVADIRAEGAIRVAAWGKIVTVADPFGHGLCLIQFLGRGYDEIAGPNPSEPSPLGERAG